MSKLKITRKGYPKKLLAGPGGLPNSLGGTVGQSFFGLKGLEPPKLEPLPFASSGLSTPAGGETAGGKKGLFSLSSEDKDKLTKAVIGRAGDLAGNMIGGGYGSTAGTIMSTASKVASQFSPELGAALSVGSGVMNRLIGKKVNQEAIASNKANLAQLSQLKKASSFDDVGSLNAVANALKEVSYGALGKSKERKEFNKVKQAQAYAQDLAFRNQAEQAYNLSKDQVGNAEAVYAAYGGPIYPMDDPSTAIGYENSTQLFIKNNLNLDSNMTNLFAGVPSTMFADGGTLPEDAVNIYRVPLTPIIPRIVRPIGEIDDSKYLQDIEDIEALQRQINDFNRQTDAINIPAVPVNDNRSTPVLVDNPTSLNTLENSLRRNQLLKDRINDFNRQTMNLNVLTPQYYDIGGVLQTNGSNFGNVTHIDAGGTHEESPYDGVLIGTDEQGVPNLVEENEVIWNDYVFSNRLTVPDYRKKYKNKKEAPYEVKVLWSYSGKTFADVAKKIEKHTGADERANDLIAQDGMDSVLQLLAIIQEKEREKLQLKEQADAIDDMTPEEFAAMQLLEQAQLAAEEQVMQEVAQQEAQQAALQAQQPTEELLAMMLLQLMMQLQQGMNPQEAMMQGLALPMAAYGGRLFKNGGALSKFKKSLESHGITLELYLWYLNSTRDIGTPEITVLNDETFDTKKGEAFLSKVNTTSRKYDRKAKLLKLKPSSFNSYEKDLYEKLRLWAILQGATKSDYNIDSDTELAFNDPSISKSKDPSLAYTLLARYEDLLTRGGKSVELDEKGRSKWEELKGLKKVENDAENFYGIADNLTEDNGVYDVSESPLQAMENYDNFTLYGWKRGDDGNYSISKERTSPDLYSLKSSEFSKSTYPISALGRPEDNDVILYGLEGYDTALNNILNNSLYLGQTNKVKDAINKANKNYNALPKYILNYLKYLDEHTGNEEKKLLVKDDNGNISIADDAAELYESRRNDGKYGIYHYMLDDSNKRTGARYYYWDGDKKIYIKKPGEEFEIISKSPTKEIVGDTEFTDYEVKGLNKNRTLVLIAPGKVVDVSDVADLPSWGRAKTPVLLDNTDNLGLGINGSTNWVLGDTDPKYKGNTGKGDFPNASTWPYIGAGAIILGSTLYNALSPADYSGANAMIKAALDAGAYSPIQFRPIGNYLTYNPMDIWYEGNKLDANTRAIDRQILNSGVNQGVKNSAMLVNSLNNQIAHADLYHKALTYNDALQKQVEEFNRGTDLYNSEGFLKADMANQDAATKARGFNLEGLKSGYAMKQAIADAKSNAINAGLNSFANLLFSYSRTKDLNALLKYGHKNVYTNALGGELKKRNKKNKKLTF